MELVEKKRRAQGLTQVEVARACGITQGHYSKLAQRRIEPGRKATDALGRWLEAHGGATSATTAKRRLESLAAAIQGQCAELVRLARRADGRRGRKGELRSAR